MAPNPPHGFGLQYDSARHQGTPWGRTVLWRVCEGLRIEVDISLPAARVLRSRKELV